MTLRAVPKPQKPKRSPAYLRFVREHPCCMCGRHAPSDPHHFGPRGLGQKADDRRTVPLCRNCHNEHHAHHTVAGIDPTEQPALFHKTMVALLIEWLDRKAGSR